MARPLRIEFAGAWYHVMNRGAGRRRIFRNDADRRYFLKLLGEIGARFKAEIHAYCLMDNHYHLLLRTPEANLGRLMRHLNGVYTQYHNRQSRQDGALFRGRYKAILVEAETYWTHLSCYIHRTPLEAGVVRKLAAYRWSSYPAYAGAEPAPAWLTTAYLLNSLGGRAQYRRFVESGETLAEVRGFYASQRQAPVLGSEKFRKGIAHGLKPHRDVPGSRHLQRRPKVGEILESVARYYAVSTASLRTMSRGRGVKGPGRGLAMCLCQEAGGMKLGEIADAFHLGGYASAGAAIRNVRARLAEESGKELRKDLNYILQDLTP